MNIQLQNPSYKNFDLVSGSTTLWILFISVVVVGQHNPYSWTVNTGLTSRLEWNSLKMSDGEGNDVSLCGKFTVVQKKKTLMINEYTAT